MPLPLLIPALISGGTLVAHSSGGLIVSGAAGYIAGTFVSTAAVKTLLVASTLGVSACVGAAAASVWGSAGLFGTTIGATGIKGALMSAGLISSTPIWIPCAVIGTSIAGLGFAGFGLYRINKLREKLDSCPEGEEVYFTDKEAAFIEWMIRKMQKKEWG